LGLIHVRNRISQQRPLRVEDRMRIRTWVEGHWETDRGQEIDVRTEIDVGSDVLWTEISTYLRRTIRTATRPTRASLSALKAQVPEGAARSSFEADARVGRRYARVSRDFNPIHLADFAARRFGFKRAIAHGMWSVARCVAELPEATFAHPCLLDVAFKAPVMLRASVTLDSWRTNVELKFSLRNSQSGRDHLQGSVRPI
jgi:acyl dehydratase